jgi:predicted ATPase/DNA-binding winged helix-turn-helix (wHTH) protein
VAKTYKVGAFEVQPHTRRLLRAGEPQPLGARAFDLLLALIERRDRVAGKEELLLAVWPGLVVEENNLTVQISALRKVLGPGLIATVPGRGYRFTGEPEADAGPAAAATAARAAAAPQPVPASALPSNLPALLPPLIGRAEELRALDAFLGGQRLVTLVGAGGMGKTSLARHALAHRLGAHAHGGCWVDLAPLSDAEGVPAAVASALGLSLGGGEPAAALAEALAPLSLLLVLDNAEHLAAGVAALVTALLPRAPGLHLLVTSQVPLRTSGEQLFRLHPLPVADAVALFAARAQAVGRPFALDEANTPAVAGLCEALDGNPMAIELAASRLPLLGLTALAAALGERLRLLRAAPHGAPERRHSVLAAIEWSYGLLAPREQAAFCGLAVFAGAVTLPPIQAVLRDDPGSGLGDDWAVIDALAELVDRSLVAVTADEPPRYRLLESPRAFAREQLARRGEAAVDRLRGRHAQAFADQAERQIRLAEVDDDVADLRAALAWAAGHDIGAALILAARLAPSVKRVSLAEQTALQRRFEQLLAQPEAAAAGYRAACAQSALAQLLCDSEPLAAAPHAEAAAAWFAAHGHREDEYLARCVQALSQAILQPPAAAATLERLLALHDPAWPALTLANGAQAESKVAHFAGDAARARSAMRRQVALRESMGLKHHGQLANLVMIERKAGNAAEALRLALSLIEQLRGTRAERSLHFARLNACGAAYDLKRGDVVREQTRAAWPAVHRFGLYRAWLYKLIDLCLSEGRTGAAQRLLHATRALRADSGAVPVQESDLQEMEELLARAQQGWSAADVERLRREGTAMTSDEVLAVGLDTADAA